MYDGLFISLLLIWRFGFLGIVVLNDGSLGFSTRLLCVLVLLRCFVLCCVVVFWFVDSYFIVVYSLLS